MHPAREKFSEQKSSWVGIARIACCFLSKAGSGKENGFGLYDMHGNVYEWTADWHGCSYPSSSINPMCGSTGSSRVQRGGYWSDNPNYIRAANRNDNTPSARYATFGARLARSAP